MSLVGAAGATAAPAEPVLIVDDFEYASGLPTGTDADGVPVGYATFAGAGSTIALANPGTPPAPELAAHPAPSSVLAIDVDVTSYAGLIHSFENEGVDTWVSQDWSAYEGLTLWLYGQGSGSTLFIDLLENRNPGSTKDDAQRWTVDLKDDFTGWKQLEIPFSSFSQKLVGNGAPTDDFERYEMHGWAIGALGTGGARTYFVDDLGVYGVAPIAPLAVTFTTTSYSVGEGTTGDITVELNRPLLADDPAQVTVDYTTEPGTAVAGREYTPTSGTLTFSQDGPRELSFPLETFDDAKYEGDERVVLRLSNPSDGLAAGFSMQAAATITDDDAWDPLLLDDFESAPALWHSDAGVELDTPEIAADAANAVPGQGAYEHVLTAASPEAGPGYLAQIQDVIDGLDALTRPSSTTVKRSLSSSVASLTTSIDADYWTDAFSLDHRDGARAIDRMRQATTSLRTVISRGTDAEVEAARAASDTIVGITSKLAANAIVVAERNSADTRSVARARAAVTRAESALYRGRTASAISRYRMAWSTATTAIDKVVKNGGTLVSPSIGRDFAIGQDWSAASGLSFWYEGQNSGKEVAVELLDNRAADTSSDRGLAWSDEFDTPAGTAPDPTKWGYEIGDGTANGIPGWGNDELQYYTDSTENAATDGEGNLVITAKAADGSLQCYYGPCEVTSARLLSANKAEFAYGRIESRIQVPAGEDGLWPAFWSLGTDTNRVGWPQTGEIDIMEHVSRIPDEVFGTIHGPGYSGGSAYGNIQNIPDVAAAFHTFAIDWPPDRIDWYVDDLLYHSASPADVAPNAWVFNDPVYLLLNMAIGGNFGSAVSPDLTYPQEMKVDYVRVYQGPHTAERFEAPFVDDFTGWQQVTVPFDEFIRSADQPDGAPDDGLGLDDVWGYGFRLPQSVTTAPVVATQSGRTRPVAPFRHGYVGWGSLPSATPEAVSMTIDQVRLLDNTAPTVAITDDVDGETATGPVTFTFAFSEDVGTSFTKDDVELAGGTKGTFTRVDGTHATLVATPPADTEGVLEVSVPAGAFIDLAGNASASTAGATQAYLTPPAASGGLVLTFDEATPPVLTGFGGAQSSTVVTDPTDTTDKVAQVVKADGAEIWAGTTVSTQDGLTVPDIAFATGATTITARVWSPEAGIPVRLKVENATNGSVSVETEATTTVAGAWETLTFDFANQVTGTPALDLTATYAKVSIFVDFGTNGTGATYYLDDLTFP